MNERNMLCSSHQIHDLMNGQQGQSHLRPDPCMVMGSTSNFHPSHMNQVLPPSGNVSNFDLHNIPEHAGRPAFFGMTQYNQPTHPGTNLELGIPTTSNFFNLHLNPAPGGRVFPVPLNHGFVDHSLSSSNYRSNAVSFGEYGRNNFSTEDVRGLCKRKNAEGIPGNVQHFGASAGPSSSSAAPLTSCHFESGPAPMDAPLALQEYRSNASHSMMEVGGTNARHRSGAVGVHMDTGMLHNYNHIPQGNYGNQSFPPSSCTWLDQQAINSSGGLPWNGPPMLPYFQGSSIHGGALEMGNGGLLGYPEASNNHGSANFLPSPPILQQHHNLHPSQRGYGVACYPPFLAGPTRVPTNDGVQHDAIPLSPESAETTSRPTGIRIYRSHGRGMLPDAASRRRDFPRLRNLPGEGVAILEFPYEVDFDDFIDNHRDMRLDIDDMSYEELLALSDRIGTVSTGLSEDDITGRLKTKRYSSTTATINLEELPCIDQNNDSCIICLDEYEDKDQLGTLDCGHEYHAGCLKKWLLVKNVCPICKAPALTVEQKGR